MLTDSVSVDGDHIDVLIVGEMIKLRNYYTEHDFRSFVWIPSCVDGWNG